MGDGLGNVGQYEKGIRIGRQGIYQALKNGMESILSMALFDCGWNMEHLQERGGYTKKTGLQYMKTSYYLHMIYDRRRGMEFIRRYVEEEYNEKLN